MSGPDRRGSLHEDGRDERTEPLDAVLLAEYAELERGWPTPRCTPTRRAPASSAGATRSSTRSCAPPTSWPRPAATSRRRPRAGRRGPGFADEAAQLADRVGELEAELARAAGPARPATTARTSIIEVKAGEGGEESALFAGDLLRMYLRYAERRGWKTEVLAATESDLGGYKDVTRRREGPGDAGRTASGRG